MSVNMTQITNLIDQALKYKRTVMLYNFLSPVIEYQ